MRTILVIAALALLALAPAAAADAVTDTAYLVTEVVICHTIIVDGAVRNIFNPYPGSPYVQVAIEVMRSTGATVRALLAPIGALYDSAFATTVGVIQAGENAVAGLPATITAVKCFVKSTWLATGEPVYMSTVHPRFVCWTPGSGAGYAWVMYDLLWWYGESPIPHSLTPPCI